MNRKFEFEKNQRGRISCILRVLSENISGMISGECLHFLENSHEYVMSTKFALGEGITISYDRDYSILLNNQPAPSRKEMEPSIVSLQHKLIILFGKVNRVPVIFLLTLV